MISAQYSIHILKGNAVCPLALQHPGHRTDYFALETAVSCVLSDVIVQRVMSCLLCRKRVPIWVALPFSSLSLSFSARSLSFSIHFDSVLSSFFPLDKNKAIKVMIKCDKNPFVYAVVMSEVLLYS